VNGTDKDLRHKIKDTVKNLQVKGQGPAQGPGQSLVCQDEDQDHDFMVKDNNTAKSLQIKIRTYGSR